jgi:hypothetical protein
MSVAVNIAFLVWGLFGFGMFIWSTFRLRQSIVVLDEIRANNADFEEACLRLAVGDLKGARECAGRWRERVEADAA